MIENKNTLLEGYTVIIAELTNSKTQEKEGTQIDEECAAIEAVIEKLIAENARKAIEQQEYHRKYNAYATRYNELQKRRQELNT